MATLPDQLCRNESGASAAPLRVAVIGYGYWGPNVARNIHALDQFRLAAICDTNPAALRSAGTAFPGVDLTTDYQGLLRSRRADAVAIVTPVWTHFALAKAALENGKHVFVEKPFTSTSRQAEELINMAARANLQIMVDHTFLFTGAVKKIRELIDEGVLGDLYYYDSMRVNLGLFQHDINVVWDLAPHDLSIMDHLIQRKPEALVATGERHLNGHIDVSYITVYFPGNVIAHINVNWLSPVKVRTTLIGGEKRMVVWNDLDADETLKVYDKGVQVGSSEPAIHQLLVSYRSGDMWAPKVDRTEALRSELGVFGRCVLESRPPINDGQAGLRVVQLLEAVDQSLKEKGKVVRL